MKRALSRVMMSVGFGAVYTAYDSLSIGVAMVDQGSQLFIAARLQLAVKWCKSHMCMPSSIGTTAQWGSQSICVSWDFKESCSYHPPDGSPAMVAVQRASSVVGIITNRDMVENKNKKSEQEKS